MENEKFSFRKVYQQLKLDEQKKKCLNSNTSKKEFIFRKKDVENMRKVLHIILYKQFEYVNLNELTAIYLKMIENCEVQDGF